MANPAYTETLPPDLLEGLNDQQRAAVVHPGGPLLVVAGAGTGKTRVLTRRVGWLVGQGVPPWRILAITFTNKAAQVLKHRLAALPGAESVWAGTFHGFGARLLRREGHRIGIDPSFTIVDREDQQRIVRDLIDDEHDRWGLSPARSVALIGHVKGGGGGRAPYDLPDEARPLFDALLRAYGERLRAGALIDFDDLLLESVRLLREVPDVARAQRERFLHVLVDEYQDTNVIQGVLVREITGEERNLTVVGDPDQSIYRWRGASVRNILDFAADFPGATTRMLERNYRSTARILAAAEHVIVRNVQRHEKRLFTENAQGPLVRVILCADADREGEAVAQALREWSCEGRSWDDMAVFYRVNSHSRAIEMALKAARIPYAVVQGVEFFHRAEVKDVLAYARLVENPRDEAAFLRIANVPRRGIGRASLDALTAAARERGVPAASLGGEDVPGVSARARKGLAELAATLDALRAQPRAPVTAVLQAIVDRTGYVRWLRDTADDDVEETRVENVTALLDFAATVDEEDPDVDLRAFLERTSLVADQDAWEEDGGRVSLMSVHAAKGLEFSCVAIAGAEHGLFPHIRSEDRESLEEERRLFYVAMTRARERLSILRAQRRTTRMGTEFRAASPYLGDIPAGVVEHVVHGRAPGAAEMLYDADDGDPEVDFVREVGAEFDVGDRVRHPYFGEGRVQEWHGEGANRRATVDFDAFGTKQLLLTYANLERIG